MKRKTAWLAVISLLFSLLLSSCSRNPEDFSSSGSVWNMGFGSQEISLPENSEDPLYIAGYKNGSQITGVLDLPRASAVWMDTGENGILLIGIDCVGLAGGTVDRIRRELADFCRISGCAAVHVYATHTHAGVDTLGLWGPIAIDGKNPDYMDNLIDAAVSSAKKAYADRSQGKLYFGSAEPEGLLHDSREPAEYDPRIHQIRFAPENESNNGIRMLFYAAHAESLRSANNQLSRDFPGMLADGIKNACGDDVMVLPGAIGGLIMTRELVAPFDAEENMKKTAELLAEAVLSISDECELAPTLAAAGTDLVLPLDNTFFFFAKFLGIIDHRIVRGTGDTGYSVKSELNVLKIGSVTLALIPGEIFPELVSGQGLSEGDPEALESIAQRNGIETLLIVGLCNDEIGYIVPPGVYLLNEELPYIEPVTDASGENHYEETNSVGIQTAELIAQAFETVLAGMAASKE